MRPTNVSGRQFLDSSLLCHSQPHRPHKVTGSTHIFSHNRHGPVATTSAPEATMSNIAVQMRHSSTTVAWHLQAHEPVHVDGNVCLYHRVFGQVLIFVMERRREYRRILVVEAHALALGPLRIRPMHQVHVQAVGALMLGSAPRTQQQSHVALPDSYRPQWSRCQLFGVNQ